MTAAEARHLKPRVKVRLPDGTVVRGNTINHGGRGGAYVLIQDWKDKARCIRLRVSWKRIANAVTMGSPVNILRGDRA